MKCSQKSCNRKSSNSSSGFCSVCEEVVKDTTEKVKNISKERIMGGKVDIDFKKLLEIHEVIASGSVNGVILGGIVNIFIQHNAIEELVEKVKSVEEVNKTLNTRVESLETLKYRKKFINLLSILTLWMLMV